jgi:hypothetical protein
MKKLKFLFLLLSCLAGCDTVPKENSAFNKNEYQALKAKSEIETVLRASAQCGFKRDIDCFMDSTDDTFILESNEAADKDRVISKDTLKKDILRDWSIIKQFHEVVGWIDSFYLASPDSAIVFTNQFFHRSFKKPNDLPGEDDIISTQKHREIWVKRKTGWKQTRIKELGGFIYVNGKRYNSEQ